MKTLPCVVLLAMAAAASAQQPAPAPQAPSGATPGVAAGTATSPVLGGNAKAAERCEAEVERTLRRIRGRAVQEVQFLAARRALNAASDDETSVRGEGRYRGSGAGAAVPFSYSCAYNSKNDSTSGAVFRELVAPRAAPERPFEPDLSRLSPEACESAVAGLLKTRHPRVDRITFGSETRRIEPAGNGLMQLAGQGAMQRAPGMYATAFGYRCEVDPRNGRIVEVDAGDNIGR
jgi:hypothetical protein